ncbi:hypothetical protein PpBr36_04760 [Pyricularia pennisetigena]|uniref:hypothetical protein n=1 Tax=Pyricularia pennisetigena TaxID=1578925 RepID=UPI0011537552|nr:hypothetical protein PpBr36_04760 [Pyricularia pennisetigena]TLS26390.1 hypothetical protein PpBr36_04760 [Pyricularia pennisetigena]
MAERITESKASTPLGVAVFAIVLSAIFVALRVYTRIYAKTSFWLDDYFTIVSFFVLLGAVVGVGIMTEFGLGKHIETVADDDVLLFKRARFVTTVLYTIGLLTIKMTFLLQYLRMLGDEWRAYRKFLASALLIGLWAMSEVWVNVFICIPVEGIWNSSISSSCIPNGPYQYVYISLDVISAIAVFLFPIMFLRHMIIGWPEAVALAAVFTLGIFVVVLQFVRLQYVNLGRDFTWTFAERASLMVSEMAIALLCTCVPLLHPLAYRLFPRWFCTFGYENGDRNNKSPRRGDMEKSHDNSHHKHHDNITLGTKGWSSSGFGCGFLRDAGSQQKNQNHTPHEALDDGRPSLRRDDSGDMSDDIMGLQSALRGLKRISFNRSQSDDDAGRSPQPQNSREQATQSSRPGMGRTHCSPYMQSPTLGWERSGSSMDVPQKNPTAAARPPPSSMPTNKGRQTTVASSRRQSLRDENEARPVPHYASEQQQQQQNHSQRQQHLGDLHHGTFYNSLSDSQSPYYNKKLPVPPRRITGGMNLYEEHRVIARFG